MQMEQAVFVLHDWSGPIALPWVAEHAERVAGLLLLNTFAPRLPGPIGSLASIRAFRSRGLGSWLVKRRAVPVEEFLFKAGMAAPERLDEQAKDAYRAPHPTPASREAMLAFPRQIPLRQNDPVAEASRRAAAMLEQRLADTPVAFCWGSKDILFGEDVLTLWTELFPHADVSRIGRAGHFVPEGAPDDLARSLLALLHRSSRP